MVSRLSLFGVMLFSTLLLNAQANAEEDINIMGKVTDTDGKAVSGAAVKLEKRALTAMTDAEGNFSLVYKGPAGFSQNTPALSKMLSASICNGLLSIHVPEKSPVIVTTFSLEGRALSKFRRNLNAGAHSMAVPSSKANIYLYKVKSGDSEVVLKGLSTEKYRRRATLFNQANAMPLSWAKQTGAAAAFNDTLTVTKNGYEDFSMAIDNAKKSGLIIQMKSEEAQPAGDSKPVGWASVKECGENGTTGGGSGVPAVTVTSGSDFIAAATSGGKKVIAVKGKISGIGGEIAITDKTIIGISGAEISGGIYLRGARNVIFKNILFSDGSDDTFTLDSGTCVWFDHCEFRDGKDGNLDIVEMSDLVTVSWSKFYYTRGHNHMVSNLCGNRIQDKDIGKINITFHHNWWGAGVRSRAPRVRYGKVHVFNNYYKFVDIPGGGGDNSKVAAGFESKLLVENNYFEDIRRPMGFNHGSGEIVHSGNVFVNTGNQGASRGSAFTPPYSYSLDDASAVKDLVMAGAGRH